MASWTPYSLDPSASTVPVNFGAPGLGRGSAIVKVGSLLYYVTTKQFVPSSPTYELFIKKSTDGGITWTTKYTGPFAAYSFTVAAVGTVIYILCDDYNVSSDIIVKRWDTITDTLLSDGTPSGNQVDSNGGIASAVWPDGKILLAYVNDSSGELVCDCYDPVGDFWAGESTLDTSGFVYDLAIDSVSITAFVLAFDSSGNFCVFPITAPNTGFSPGLLNTPNSDFDESCIGNVTISNGDVVVSYLDPPTQTSTQRPGELHLQRASISTAPAFSAAEDVEISLVDPQAIFDFSFSGPNAWAVIDDGAGTLYAIYPIMTDPQELSTTQVTLVYKTSTTPGTWSAYATVWSGPFPSSLLLIKLLLVPGGIGILAVDIDPTLGYGGTGLAVLYLAPPFASQNNYVSAGGALAGPGSYASA